MEKDRYVELLAKIELAIEIKFGDDANGLYEQMTHVTDLAKLKAVQRAIRSVAHLDELRKLL